MNIQKISRSYQRTVTVTMPNGGEAWIKHEAAIEAVVDENDAPRLHECYAELDKIAVSEVAGAVNRELALIAEKRKQMTEEPFPGNAPSMSNLKTL